MPLVELLPDVPSLLLEATAVLVLEELSDDVPSLPEAPPGGGGGGGPMVLAVDVLLVDVPLVLDAVDVLDDESLVPVVLESLSELESLELEDRPLISCSNIASKESVLPDVDVVPVVDDVSSVDEELLVSDALDVLSVPELLEDEPDISCCSISINGSVPSDVLDVPLLPLVVEDVESLAAVASVPSMPCSMAAKLPVWKLPKGLLTPLAVVPLSFSRPAKPPLEEEDEVSSVELVSSVLDVPKVDEVDVLDDICDSQAL
ncbi:MAG: hypothetical protein PW843_08480 [Azospirillaceae bacterium]|nr:hypothetical protein [Azospirillaceae bacterium]